jgi:predicted metal-dependent peptidase
MDHLEESDVRQLYADPAGAARQARDNLAAVRVWLMKHKPFFGVLARALRLEATLEVVSFRLLPDDRVLFHPVVVLGASLPSLCARLAHLSMHAALGAYGRRREREPRRWNVAHDLAIAPLLDAAELRVGTTTDLPPGASAEQHYERLAPDAAPDPHWCDLCDPLTDDTTRSPPEEPRGGAPTADERGRELQWKMRLAAAFEEEVASGGLTFGDVPGWLEEMVRATIEPPADWSVALQQSISQLHRTDRSWLRPSRRTSALVGSDGVWPDVVTMPGRRVEPSGRLVVVIDTSASVAPPTLARFLGAVAAAATAEGIDEVRLLQADATVTGDRTLHSAELLFEAIPMLGRGGTDFAPALALLAAAARREAQRFTVVYLTDLDGRFPAAADVRHLDVLWVVPRRTEIAPPFGRVVVMEPAR